MLKMISFSLDLHLKWEMISFFSLKETLTEIDNEIQVRLYLMLPLTLSFAETFWSSASVFVPIQYCTLLEVKCTASQVYNTAKLRATSENLAIATVALVAS
jgi:hypothetical protein